MKKIFINRRKKNISNINIYITLSFIIIILFFFYIFFNYKKIINTSVNFVEEYSNNYEYNLSEIKISNINFLMENEILNYFNSYIGKSIFLIPLKKIANEIREIKWVKNINIKSNYKNTLIVIIEEEIPLGIYDNNNQRILFSEDLIVLDTIQNNSNYNNLITFYGSNSLHNSKKLFINLDNDFEQSVESATYIADRRWNLKLKNQIILKLPEKNINRAITNYKNINLNFSNTDLKDIESIDLRINNNAIIKYKDKKND